jgi:hypothetical protein
MTEDSKKIRHNCRVNAFYTNKIHSDPDFYEKDKQRVTQYQNNRYKTDEEYKEKRKEYCRLKMKEYYQRKKEKSIVVS